MRVQPIVDSWPLSTTLIPPRTPLFPLGTIGVGTAFVESLTSYIMRLAEEHSLRVGDLVGRFLADAARAVGVSGRDLTTSSYAINGVTDRVAEWVHTLEVATGRRDLRYLTLLPFRHVLSTGSLSRHRAWCSLCFEQLRAEGQTVYEPLLWTIKVASHCQVHGLPLSSTCHHCKRTQNLLGFSSRPGYCERCGGWLGAPYPNIDHSLSSATDWKNQIWVCKEVGSLLEMLPGFDPAGAKKSLRKSLIVYLEQVADGNVLALAKHIRCSHRNLQSWLDGAHTPQLDSLLRISRFLDVPTSSLFSPSGPTPTNIVAANQSYAVLGKRDVFPYRHSCKIRQALLEALNDAVPLSLSDVARRLGYTGIDRLYASDRKLCNKIVDRYRKSDRGQWWSKPGATRICEAVRIKEILEQSLKSNQPISVLKIAARLGYANSGFIRRKFPDLCTAISQRIAEANQARFERMHQILKNSLQEDPAPTLTDLSHRLGYSAPTVLRVHEPALCSEIAARYPADHAKRRAAIERSAAAMLEETPVPSVRDVCKRLAITVRFMDVYFPATRSLIAQQHSRSLSIERDRRRELLFREALNIATELHSQGLYPSYRRIFERLPKETIRQWKIRGEAARVAQETLGILR